jgi:hypothetical protein
MYVEKCRNIFNNISQNADLPASKDSRRQNKAPTNQPTNQPTRNKKLRTSGVNRRRLESQAQRCLYRQTNRSSVRSPHCLPHPADTQNKGSQDVPARHVLKAKTKFNALVWLNGTQSLKSYMSLCWSRNFPTSHRTRSIITVFITASRRSPPSARSIHSTS